jgi:hypothetical protein
VVSFSEVRDRMAKGVRRFEYGDDVSPALLAELDAFLAEAERRKILVVAFLAPYAPSIYDEMAKIGRWGYVAKVHRGAAPIFEAHHHELFDFSDVRELGLEDADFYDGFHGSERTHARIVLALAERSPRFAAVVDAAGIEAMIAKSDARLVVVPERERR